MSAANNSSEGPQSLRHLHALRNFIANLVDQSEKSEGCECHKPPSLLLVGPPGAGKTYLVKQMSKVCEMPLFGVHTHMVKSPNDIEKLFRQAREQFPSLVFLDDVDCIFADHEKENSCSLSVQHIREAIFSEMGPRKLKINDPKSSINPTRHEVQSSPGSSSSRASSRSSSLGRPPRPSAPPHPPDLLNDSYDESLYPDNNGIIVVAATSEPWKLYQDHELLSRFRGVYLVGLPDKPSRFALLQQLLSELHHTLTDTDIHEVAERTQGFTPADLLVVVKTLGYRQFSFLLNMNNGDSAGNSPSPPPDTSSEVTETGSDTDIDGLSEPKGSKNRSSGSGAISGTAAAVAVAAAAATLVSRDKKSNFRDNNGVEASAPSSSNGIQPATAIQHPKENPAEGLIGRVAAAGAVVAGLTATVASLQHDWQSESEEEENGMSTVRERTAPPLDEPDALEPVMVTSSPVAQNCSDNNDITDRNVESLTQPSNITDNTQSSSTAGSDSVFLHNTDRREDHASADAETNKADDATERVLNGSADSEDNNKENEESSSSSESDSTDSADESTQSNVFYPNAEEGEYSLIEEGDHHPHANEGGSHYPHEEDNTVDSTGCQETEEIIVKPECRDAPPSSPADFNDDEPAVPASVINDFSGEEGSHELHYSEPPDAMRDDNMAIDSDSDGEGPMRRPRRVGFAGPRGGGGMDDSSGSRSGAVNPLSVDCEPDMLPPNVTMMGGAAGDNILRQLLSRPPMNNGAGGSGHSHHSSPTPPASPAPSNCSSGAATLASSGSGRATPANDNHQQQQHHPLLHPQDRTPNKSPQVQHVGMASNVAPIRHRPPQRLPHGVATHHMGGGDSPDMNMRQGHHQGLGASPKENKNRSHHREDDSDDQTDATLKAVTGLGAAAAAAVAAVNSSAGSGGGGQPPMSQDDMAKLVDALEAQLGGFNDLDRGSSRPDSEAGRRRRKAGENDSKKHNGRVTDSDETSTGDDDDEEEMEEEEEERMRMLNADEIAEVGIQAITLADVIEVIDKGYRSISDDEIKKYTDFMVWFANVAKSACPHGNKSESNTHDEDDYAESTLCATPSIQKRTQRRKPLRKLGRFLLKALMFILD